MTSRRAFLASVAAALVLDPERALWVPGRKLISIPKLHVGVDPARGLAFNIHQLFHFRADGVFVSIDGGPWEPVASRPPLRVTLTRE